MVDGRWTMDDGRWSVGPMRVSTWYERDALGEPCNGFMRNCVTMCIIFVSVVLLPFFHFEGKSLLPSK